MSIDQLVGASRQRAGERRVACDRGVLIGREEHAHADLLHALGGIDADEVEAPAQGGHPRARQVDVELRGGDPLGPRPG